MGLIFFRSSLALGEESGFSADFWSWIYFATQFILLTKLDWKVFFRILPVLELNSSVRATSKGSSNRYAALGPESRFEGQRGEPAQSLCPYCLPWGHLRVWEHYWLAPRSLPALVFSALTLLVPLPRSEREREGGQREREAQRLLQGASCGIAECGLWLVSGSRDVGIGAKQITSSPQASCDQWESCLHNPERFLRLCCTLGGGGFCWKTFPLAD